MLDMYVPNKRKTSRVGQKDRYLKKLTYTEQQAQLKLRKLIALETIL